MRTLWQVIGCAVLTVATASQASAALILHFDDYGGGGNQVGQALTQLGQTATIANHSNFSTVLGSNSWDLVIVDISGNTISNANQTALINYINGGGRAIMSYWSLNTASTLATEFDVTVGSSIGSPLPVYAWDLLHPIIAGPPAVSSPVAFGPDLLGDNGDKLILSGGVGIAGFTASPSAGEAAIVVGNGGRTVVNGFSFDELNGQNGINLIKNEITFQLNANTVPEPATLTIWGCLGLAGLVAARGRKKLTT